MHPFRTFYTAQDCRDFITQWCTLLATYRKVLLFFMYITSFSIKLVYGIAGS